MTTDNLTFTSDEIITITTPTMSEWTCYMFGAENGQGIQYRPINGREPHWFARWMMRICFDCKWVKQKE